MASNTRLQPARIAGNLECWFVTEGVDFKAGDNSRLQATFVISLNLLIFPTFPSFTPPR
jgi:hypothetical protein